MPASRSQRTPWAAPRKAAGDAPRQFAGNRGAPIAAGMDLMEKTIIEAGAQAPMGELVGAFRWSGQADEVRIFNDAGALLVEFRLPQRAAGTHADRRAPMPVSPVHMGVSCANDIGAHNYAELAALYRVEGLAPPPATTGKTAILAYGEQKLLPLPAGYYVSNASVSFLDIADGDTAPGVLVGRETLHLGDSWTQTRSFGQEYAILATFPAPGQALDAAADPFPDARQKVRVTIECAPSPSALLEWRNHVYDSVFRAFQKQALHAAGQRGGAIGRRRELYSPQQTEQMQLHQACLRMLYQRAFEPGEAGQLSQAQAPDPLFRQFAEVTFDWSAMRVEAVATASAAAIVRVPVRPEHALALMYFLETGRRWEQRGEQDGDELLLLD